MVHIIYIYLTDMICRKILHGYICVNVYSSFITLLTYIHYSYDASTEDGTFTVLCSILFQNVSCPLKQICFANYSKFYCWTQICSFFKQVTVKYFDNLINRKSLVNINITKDLKQNNFHQEQDKAMRHKIIYS